MQPGKNIKIFINYFLGPLLFAWLCFSIYRQVTGQPQLEQSWLRIRQSFGSGSAWYLAAALVLIPVNWGIEAWKWKLSVKDIHPISFLQSFKAILCGVSISVTMPNRVGEYLGRMMYLPEGARLKAIAVTLVGSFAQLLVTIVAGTAGLVVLKKSLLEALPDFRIWYQFVLYGLVAMALLVALIYGNVAGAVPLFRRWVRWKRYAYLVEALDHFRRPLLLQLLLLSLLRYGVFLLQYIFVFYLFDVEVPAATVMAVMSVVFLAMAVIPSIALVEVGLRSEISIRLMGLFSANILGISLSSVTVWCLNLILPAIAGSLLIVNIRVFNKRNGRN